MKIEKLNYSPIRFIQNKNNEKHSINAEPAVHKDYKPIAYRDYNINFTARLFRTPANFYAQPFNREGMPDTMKEYLFEDYEDRQNMPPAQMLKIVFNDIKETDSLEEARKLYKDEPLFSNLTDIPNRKSRTGVLAEIDLMKDDNIPLFKDGSDNLGMYLLRKIYQEGKTLKEINTDFSKDISMEYQGLSPIQYDTISAYGIKYPNNSFWKSLTATREEFPYEYKPRKVNASRFDKEMTTPAMQKLQSEHKPVSEKKKFNNVKDWEIDKLAKAFIKGRGSKSATKKELKNTNIRDEDSLNFVSRYFSEINSIVMHRLHVSDEMRTYFENYENLSTPQKEKFETYWKNPELNRLQSIVMKETIRLFFNTYGADGNNDDFKELLDYAHNIKSKRLERQQKHDLLQQEYERELGIFDFEEEKKPVAKDIVVADDEEEADGTLEKYQKMFEELKKEYAVDSYSFDTEAGEVIIVSNLKEALKEYLELTTKIMPSAFAKNYMNYMLNNPQVSDSYILSTLLQAKGIKLPNDERLMPEDDAMELTINAYQQYSDKYPVENRAAKQAVVEAFLKLAVDDKSAPMLFRLGIFEFSDLFNSMGKDAKSFILNESKFINDKYYEYKKPLSDYENYRILKIIDTLLFKYNPNKTIIGDNSPFKGLNNVIAKMRETLSESQYHKELFNEEMKKYLFEYGGAARFFLDKKVPEELKMAKFEEFMCNYCYDKGSYSSPLGI